MTHDAPVFIGDELTAAGYRLAGARVLTPAAEELAEVFGQACGEALVVLITGELAARLPREMLATAQRSTSCHVLVVDDMLRGQPAPDLAADVRRQLGMGS